jgi:hypothetical protein
MGKSLARVWLCNIAQQLPRNGPNYFATNVPIANGNFHRAFLTLSWEFPARHLLPFHSMRFSRVRGCELGFLFTVCLLTCCNRVADHAPPTAEDVRIARGALSLTEVSLMLRTGSSQSEVIAEIKRRHVAEKIDGITEAKFISGGANSALIAALKSDQNILTPKQKAVFDRYHNLTPPLR